MITRRQAAALFLGALLPQSALSDETDFYQLQRALIDGSPVQFGNALKDIRERGKPDMAAGLITGMRFTQGPRDLISDVLAEITGETNANTWFDWMLWQEKHPEVIPHDSYTGFKRDLFMAIDPSFSLFLKPQHIRPDAMRIRFEEITWGGVRKDGIPSLDNPNLIDPDNASYLKDDDLVFGVSINGDSRAYPLRIMGWHEMFNDMIGGVPVALAYCTLCGSGILFETTVPGRDAPLVFGSSGFLYRSNKLMFDRETHSLWNQFTGRPVVGELVNSGIELVQRPVVIDTWANWRAANPDTRALSLETGHSRDYGSGVVYREYFASDDLMFPTQVDQSRLRQKDYVFGIREFGGAKAWPISAFAKTPVINDDIHGRSLVLIGDAGSRTARAFERGPHKFTMKGDALLSNDGTRWEITEDALLAEDGQELPRVAGHIAYWFAWDGYLGAASELYSP